jgi:hypothetical protein
MADRINRNLSEDGDLEGIFVCGRFDDLYFRATKTLTIADARWLAYHIELSPRLRKPANGHTGKPTGLANHLPAALNEKHGAN